MSQRIRKTEGKVIEVTGDDLKIIIQKNVDDEELFDINFTFEDFSMPESFAAMNGFITICQPEKDS